MSTPVNTDTQPVAKCNFLWSNAQIADMKDTADSCLDKAEAVSSKYSKASSNDFLPWVVNTILSLLSRLGFAVNVEKQSKSLATRLSTTSNLLVDKSSRASNIIAKPFVHKSIDISAQTSNTIKSIFKKEQ